ncbi:MAG: AAA family ATP:ADP antiporter [Candidatus Azotimanducaceae bacterium]|jgi:AAA family ATP:ADP antiporter|tara:strand:+ start:3303 stop:4517 length:1215 start_codon:yes stop_codon:yes gene_type:complete
MKSNLVLVGLMASAAFFTLTGYELIRSSATVLFKAAYGAENLPVVMALMPVVMFAGVWGYGALLTRFGPRRTLRITTIAAAVLMLLCYWALQLEQRWVTAVLFLLKEFYVVLLIEQYWSYINSRLDQDTAKRFNGPITGLAGLGSVVGGVLVAKLAIPLGTENLVLLAAMALIPAALVSNTAYRWFGEPTDVHEGPAAETFSEGVGWHFVKSNPRLLALLAIVVSSQIIAAVLDFKFQGLLSATFNGDVDAETAFQGQFWSYLNAVAVAAQFILTPILLTAVALRWVHLLLPIAHFTLIAWAIFEPSLWSVGAAFFLFKVFDYSVFRGAKELVYLPLGFQERFRAKEFIDVFGYRTSKGGSSLIIATLQKGGVVMSHYYLWIALAMASLWMVLVFPLTQKRDGE